MLYNDLTRVARRGSTKPTSGSPLRNFTLPKNGVSRLNLSSFLRAAWCLPECLCLLLISMYLLDDEGQELKIVTSCNLHDYDQLHMFMFGTTSIAACTLLPCVNAQKAIHAHALYGGRFLQISLLLQGGAASPCDLAASHENKVHCPCVSTMQLLELIVMPLPYGCPQF